MNEPPSPTHSKMTQPVTWPLCVHCQPGWGFGEHDPLFCDTMSKCVSLTQISYRGYIAQTRVCPRFALGGTSPGVTCTCGRIIPRVAYKDAASAASTRLTSYGKILVKIIYPITSFPISQLRINHMQGNRPESTDGSLQPLSFAHCAHQR